MSLVHQLSLEKQNLNEDPRCIQEYLIDGVRLSDTFDVHGFISPIGWGHIDIAKIQTSWLLLESSCQELNGRVPIYVCPCCGDFACGVITVKISSVDDHIVWEDFRWEQQEHGAYWEQTTPQKHFKRRFQVDSYMNLFKSQLEQMNSLSI